MQERIRNALFLADIEIKKNHCNLTILTCERTYFVTHCLNIFATQPLHAVILLLLNNKSRTEGVIIYTTKP